MMGHLYIYTIRGAFGVARFDLSGNARASIRGTSDGTGSTSFFVYSPTPFKKYFFNRKTKEPWFSFSLKEPMITKSPYKRINAIQTLFMVPYDPVAKIPE